MTILQIHDKAPLRFAVVDLRDVLPLLGERAKHAIWRVAGVDRYDEPPMIVGDEAADRLEALSQSQASVTGHELIELIEKTIQIIWGEFTAYTDTETSPWVIVRAIDSTWCEVETDDEDVLAAVRRSFMLVKTPT